MPRKPQAPAANLGPAAPEKAPRGGRAKLVPAARIALAVFFALASIPPAAAMGQKMEIFVPADKMVEEKRYEEALAYLQELAAAQPSRAREAQTRISTVLLLVADRDIDNQRYNEALAFLHDFMIANPLRFDEAQSRVRKINQKREEYNKKAKELLAFMNDVKSRAEAGYNIEITKRISELDDLDRNNPDAKKTITGLKETSLALVNQDAMRAIMSAGRTLLDTGRYVEAEKKYQEGFVLFKPEFDNAGFDSISVQAIYKLIERAKAQASFFEASQEEFTAASAALTQALEKGESTDSALPRALAAFESVDLARLALADSGASLTRWYQTIPKEGRSIIEYQYLAFLDLFIRGRPDSFTVDKKPEAEKGKPEGMLGGFLIQRAAALTPLRNAAVKRLDDAFLAAEGAYDASKLSEAGVLFARAALLAEPADSVLGLWATVNDAEFVPELAAYRLSISEAASEKLRLDHAGKVAAASSALSTIAAEAAALGAEAAGYERGEALGASIEELGAKIGSYRSRLGRVDSSLGTAKRTEQLLASLAKEAEKVGIGGKAEILPLARQASYLARLDAAIANSRRADVGIARAYIASLEQKVAAVEAEAGEYGEKQAASASLAEVAATLEGFRARLASIEAALVAEKALEGPMLAKLAEGEKSLSELGSAYSGRLSAAILGSRRADLRIALASLGSLSAKVSFLESESSDYGEKRAADDTMEAVEAAIAGYRDRLAALESGLDAEKAGEAKLRERASQGFVTLAPVAAGTTTGAEAETAAPDANATSGPEELAAAYSQGLSSAILASRRVEVGIASANLTSLAAKSAAIEAEARDYGAKTAALAPVPALRSTLEAFRSRLARVEAGLDAEKAGEKNLLERAAAVSAPVAPEGSPAEARADLLAAAYSERLAMAFVGSRRAEIEIASANLVSLVARSSAIETEASAYEAEPAKRDSPAAVREKLGALGTRLAEIEASLDAEKAGEKALVQRAAAVSVAAFAQIGASPEASAEELPAIAQERADTLAAAYSARLASAFIGSRRAEVKIASAGLSALVARSDAIETEASAYEAGQAKRDSLAAVREKLGALGTRLAEIEASLDVEKAGEKALVQRAAAVSVAALAQIGASPGASAEEPTAIAQERADTLAAAYSARLASTFIGTRRAEVKIASAGLAALVATNAGIGIEAETYGADQAKRASLPEIAAFVGGLGTRLAAVEAGLDEAKAGETTLRERATSVMIAGIGLSAPERADLLAASYSERLTSAIAGSRRTEVAIAYAGLAGVLAKIAAIEAEAKAYGEGPATRVSIDEAKIYVSGLSTRLTEVEAKLDAEKAKVKALVDRAAIVSAGADMLAAAYSEALDGALIGSRRAEIVIASARLSAYTARSAAIETELAAYESGQAASASLDVVAAYLVRVRSNLAAVESALDAEKAGEKGVTGRLAQVAVGGAAAQEKAKAGLLAAKYAEGILVAIASSRRAEVGIASVDLASLIAKTGALESEAAAYGEGPAASDTIVAVGEKARGYRARLATIEAGLDAEKKAAPGLAERAAAASANLGAVAFGSRGRPDELAASFSRRLLSAFAQSRRAEIGIAAASLASLAAKSAAIEVEAAAYEARGAALATLSEVKLSLDGFRARQAAIQSALEGEKTGEKELLARALAAASDARSGGVAIAGSLPDEAGAAYSASLVAVALSARRVELAIASANLGSLAAKSTAIEKETADYEARGAPSATSEELRNALNSFRTRLAAIAAGLETEKAAEAALSERVKAASSQADAAKLPAAVQRPTAQLASYSARLVAAIASSRAAEVGIASASLASYAAKAAAIEKEAADFEAKTLPTASPEALRSALSSYKIRLVAVDEALSAEKAGERALALRAAVPTAGGTAGRSPSELASAYSRRILIAMGGARRAEVAIASVQLAGYAAAAAAIKAEAANYESKTAADSPLDAIRAGLEGYRLRIVAVEASLETERAAEPALAARAVLASATLTENRPDVAEAAYKARLMAVIASARRAEIGVLAISSSREAAAVVREFSARRTAIKSAQDLIDGKLSSLPERAKAGYKDPSPSAAAILLEAEEKKIANLQATAAATLASFGAESAEVRADPVFDMAKAAVEATGKGAAELQATRAASLARAIEKKGIAEVAIRTASSLITESRRLLVAADSKTEKPAVVRKGLANSKARLEEAFGKILESSNADFVASRWDDYQRQYNQLNADLVQAKKDFVVVETFRLLADGQRFFDQTLYEQASESLAEAQAIWAEENDVDQPQVKYWLSLVKMASDTNNKREVKPSDALYYDISNYLSEARKQYSKGDSLMKAGKKTEAMKAFEAAKLSISFITRAFPLNAEARFLLLQIQKSTDPKAYTIRLPEEISKARTLLDADPQGGYSRIADLYRMEPSNATLKNLIIQAEIRVGRRNPPPTRAEIAQAAQFVSQATTLMKTGRTADLDRAETLLNQATRLEPGNKSAVTLLKDINTIKGKTKGPTLGLADQGVLDQATRAYTGSQYNQARDLLNQLLSDPAKKTRDVLKLDNDLKQQGY